MARRAVGPIAGRRQAEPARLAAPAQTLLTNALLVPLDQVAPDPGQPRRHFDEPGLAELAESIDQEGILQPILVYEDGALDDGRIRYTILDGERRYRASLRVRTDVPVIVVVGGDVADVRIRQLVANLQREELDPLEEALALRQLMQLAELSFDQVAKRIGKPKGYVQRRTDLLYDPRMMDAVRSGMMNASVAIELKRFPGAERQAYLDRVEAGERLEVAQLREEKRRARAILFGDGPDAARRARGVEGVLTSVTDGSPYRIDTDDITNDQPSSAHPTGASDATPPYRFDTDSYTTEKRRGDGESAEMHTAGGSIDGAIAQPTARDDDGRSGPTQGGQEADDPINRWAVTLAAGIVGDAPADRHTVISALVSEWREAGRPAGWGDVLLGALDGRM